VRALSEAQREDAADFAAQLQDLRRLTEMKKLGLAAARRASKPMPPRLTPRP